MAVISCKMCGGSVQVSGRTSATCEYCGTLQTFPKQIDDGISNLYNRANHFRRNDEYDKAIAIYEQILERDPTDAEAYWSLVLCRYGVTYVEDPATKKRIPTINRVQFTSIYDDDNYVSAIEYADYTQREIYKEEADRLNKIQKSILEISQKEEPFDVFICYKETDDAGRRTPDSVLAQDLFFQLKQEGFKVFFARITLEDKLGMEYEPYIFAALNSAKVMVVLGTQPEYFNAVWVKNEWSRFLALVQNDNDKVLIPAYKDMDPYNLPKEFSHLQAQDMSKLGFMQDLLRGIKKIIDADLNPVTVHTASVDTDGLLRRAFIFLGDRDFDNADIYLERVLDIEPENAQAYLGKLLLEKGLTKKEDLVMCPEPFDQSKNYKKVITYGDDALKALLLSYINEIVTRKKEKIYVRACNMLNQAELENDYCEAAELFETILDYKNATQQHAKCLELADNCRKNAVYVQAIEYMHTKPQKLDNLVAAINEFAQIPGWRDADQQKEICEQKKAQLLQEIEKDYLETKRVRKENGYLLIMNLVAQLVFVILSGVLMAISFMLDTEDVNGVVIQFILGAIATVMMSLFSFGFNLFSIVLPVFLLTTAHSCKTVTHWVWRILTWGSCLLGMLWFTFALGPVENWTGIFVNVSFVLYGLIHVFGLIFSMLVRRKKKAKRKTN